MKFTCATKEGAASIYNYLNRCNLIQLVCMIALGSGFWLSACDHPSVDPPQKTAATENKTMKSALSTADIRPQIPPLDLFQPQGVKTATFALG
jgi:hypothetical protein